LAAHMPRCHFHGKVGLHVGEEEGGFGGEGRFQCPFELPLFHFLIDIHCYPSVIILLTLANTRPFWDWDPRSLQLALTLIQDTHPHTWMAPLGALISL
jgi:hypothetical protein